MLTRGIRNNNPGNIRRGSTVWQGQDDLQTDPSFVQFIGLKWGVRALCVILLNYQKIYKLGTIRQIITRWAPPSENDTAAYINAVASAVRTNADATISLRDPELLAGVASAIIMHENGGDGRLVLPDIVSQGAALALGG